MSSPASSLNLLTAILLVGFVYGSNITEGNVAAQTETLDCKPLPPQYSEGDKCYVNSVWTDCSAFTKHLTVITKKCRRPYDRQGSSVTYTCYNGKWVSSGNTCVPDCGLPSYNDWFPWMAAIYNSTDDLICAGTIISSFHLLTSGKCLYIDPSKTWEGERDPKELLVVVGRHAINIRKPGKPIQKRKIKSWVPVGELVLGNSQSWDMAIVEVEEEFQFHGADNISPVCLDWNSYYEDFDFKDGNEAASIGWQYENGNVVPCQIPISGNVLYWQRNTCFRNIEIIQGNTTSARPDLICAEYVNENKDASACGTHPGSGLFFQSDRERYFLRGVLSSRHEVAKNYLFYTKVSAYFDSLKWSLSRNPRIPQTFKTVFWDQPQNGSGCTLPENVEYGNFSFTSGSTYVQGKWVPETTTISLSCSGSTNTFPLSFRCNNFRWVPPIEGASCRAPGTCPSIPTTASENVICKLDGATVNCDSPPNNTTALVRCKPFHTYPAVRPIYKCQNGEWDQPFTPCTLECGIKRVGVSELIIGGEDTVEHEYPWVVAIYNATNDQICGGTLISRKFVISAAHCFTDREMGALRDKNDFTIVAGKYYRDIGIEEQSAQKRKIKAIHVHEDYHGSNHRYRDDIALIEVDRDFVATNEVEPVCVDWEKAYEDYDLTDGNTGVVTGWGFTTGTGTPSPGLKKLVVPFRDKTVCLENLPPNFSQQYLVNDKFCAGYKDNNTNICQGDSGGGLYFKSDEKRYFIRGIVSISVKSGIACDPNRYALYTKVSNYLEWMESKTRRVL